MDDWAADLQAGKPDAAWDRFLERYHRLIFAAIRHYAHNHDDVMDVFARVCEALHEDDLRRLRDYVRQPQHRARFSTWLVTVVRHLTIDWFRHREGRRRLSRSVAALPPLQRRIFEYIFLDRRGHIEAYELLRSRESPALSLKEYLTELRATYGAVANGRQSGLLRELGGPAPSDEEGESPADTTDTLDARAVLTQALSGLTDEDRVAIELHVVEELPAAEVARLLGLPNAKAVYNRVYRALEVLRGQLARAGLHRGDV
jgi:RNA polymerase sigma factor (sigma-70 family)